MTLLSLVSTYICFRYMGMIHLLLPGIGMNRIEHVNIESTPSNNGTDSRVVVLECSLRGVFIGWTVPSYF